MVNVTMLMATLVVGLPAGAGVAEARSQTSKASRIGVLMSLYPLDRPGP